MLGIQFHTLNRSQLTDDNLIYNRGKRDFSQPKGAVVIV
jgi:hypothetical protein